MMSQKVVEEAFNILKAMTMKVKEGSDMWYQLLGMVAMCGWVLEQENYLSNTEEILREIRKSVRNPITS